MGRLTRDPELNPSGKVLTLSVACNRRQKNQDGGYEEEVSFFDVKVLGNRAQGLAGFLAKGRQVAVDARVQQERWDDKNDGSKRSKVVFIADEVMPLGDKGDRPVVSDMDGFAASSSGTIGSDEDIPF